MNEDRSPRPGQSLGAAPSRHVVPPLRLVLEHRREPAAGDARPGEPVRVPEPGRAAVEVAAQGVG